MTATSLRGRGRAGRESKHSAQKKGTEEPTGESCSASDFTPKASAEDKVSHGQALALTEVVWTREVAVEARDKIKPQPQCWKASLASPLEAPAGPFYLLPSQLCIWCVQGSEYKHAPRWTWALSTVKYLLLLPASLEAHLKLEVQLVLTYITDHKNAHQNPV